MHIIHKDIKSGEIKLKIDNPDDLWYLSTIIEKEDLVQGRTERKIKIGTGDATKSVKKAIYVTIKAEKIDFGKNVVRVNGIIIEGPEDVPRGSYQSIDIKVNDTIKITKQQWLQYQLKRLDEANADSSMKILVVAFDRENSIFASIKKYGYDVLLKMEGDVEKKAIETKKESTFFKDIVKQIKEYVDRHKITNVIVASPAFWKEDLMKLVKGNDLAKIITTASCSSVGTEAIEEILKRDEIKGVLKKDRASREVNLVERLLREIAKDELGAYGIDDVEEAASEGNVNILLITDGFIEKSRTGNSFEVVDSIMKIVDKTTGEIHIISSEHEGGNKLDGLGGIGAILRYKKY